MRSAQTSQPRPELKAYIRAFGSRKMVLSPEEPYQRSYVTCLEHAIVFDFVAPPSVVLGNGSLQSGPRIHYVGPQKKPSEYSVFTRSVHEFGIYLKPVAVWQLFGIPLRALPNRNFDATDILGIDIQEVWLRLAECTSFLQQVRIAEAYLMPFARNAQPCTHIMRAANYVYRSKGCMRVEKLAHQSGLGVRQFERRFLDEIGLTPKFFIRAVRFQRALEANNRSTGSRSGLEIAHEFGYFDQAHMVRDFHALGGSAPSQIQKHIAGMQLWTLTPSRDRYYL